jgi:regulator of replication initiation timing
MITDAEIEEGLKLLGPYKKFPHYFVDYPEVNVLLDLLPKALEEVKRMRAEEYTEALLLERLENDRLRASMSHWTRERDELLELRKKWEQFTEARSNIEMFILENEKLRTENEVLKELSTDKSAMEHAADEAFRFVAKDTEIDFLKEENAKLLRVKEAAEAERKAGNFISHELWDALKALDEDGK